MRKIAKMLNLVLALIILLSTVLPVISNLSKVIAASFEVQYHGKVTYGKSTVGDFTVDGARAFCIDHEKPTPPTRNSCR